LTLYISNGEIDGLQSWYEPRNAANDRRDVRASSSCNTSQIRNATFSTISLL